MIKFSLQQPLNFSPLTRPKQRAHPLQHPFLPACQLRKPNASDAGHIPVEYGERQKALLFDRYVSY